MAAVTAARAGAPVVVLEAQERPGRKILATGNGRCNLTNVNCSPGRYRGADPRFAAAALDSFPVDRTVAFFESLGVLTVVEAAGRVFPRTGQASTVLDALRFEAQRLGVEMRTQAAVEAVTAAGGLFRLRTGGGCLETRRVIFATGGRTMPGLGGSDRGIRMLHSLGHRATSLYPVLVPLTTSCRFNRQLKGVKVEARVRLDVDGKTAGQDAGEVLFTDYGLSGPPVIQLSLAACTALQERKSVTLTLDLFADREEEWLAGHIARRLADRPDTPVETAMIGLVHKRLIQVVLRETGVTDPHAGCRSVADDMCGKLAQLLKAWNFPVTGALSWNEAHVTAGGLSTAEYEPATLESRLHPGLYACGEMLDVTGECGGYNLQWAWSSGHAAGLHAAR